MKKCDVEGCNRDARRKSAKHCDMHYWRKRNGTPMDVPLRVQVPATEGYKVYVMLFSDGSKYVGMTGERCFSRRLETHRREGRPLSPFMDKYLLFGYVMTYPKTENGKKLALDHEGSLIRELSRELGDKCLNQRKAA